MSARDDAARARSAVPPAAPAAGATQLYLSLFLAVLSFFILLVGTRAP